MSRIRLDLIGEMVLFIAVGVAFGLIWWVVAGSSDMPYWVALLLIAATEVTCRAVTALVGVVRARRAGTGAAARHRKEAV